VNKGSLLGVEMGVNRKGDPFIILKWRRTGWAPCGVEREVNENGRLPTPPRGIETVASCGFEKGGEQNFLLIAQRRLGVETRVNEEG